MIEARDLWKSFGRKEVLKEVTLSVGKEVHALVGPNGSGKSTLIKCILGLLKPNRGEVKLFNERPEVGRKRVGYVGEKLGLRESSALLVELEVYCELKGCNWDEVKEVVDAWGLRPYLKERVRDLSTGTKQRAAIARSLLGKPEALIWDEALNGLDPEWRSYALDFMKEFSKRGPVLYSSHVLEELEEVADKVTMIENGKVILSGPLWELLYGDPVELFVLSPKGRIREVIRKDEIIDRLTRINDFSIIRIGKSLRKVYEEVRA
ncbi:hypothetical protein IPA_01275 [Ignicoccus pacificus DSM 13166]|uniref:ABC transporter domain-containing protein n=1 Tax=Ignicoccus pacificus DSM 13166 TaxID=940294 RepID=A0A977PL30_9CREN|nr:hypothetical protein IPA_01275 [Ignicoccus pacificus DSM 13166]